MPALFLAGVLALAVAGQIEPGPKVRSSPTREPFKQLFLTPPLDTISPDNQLLERKSGLLQRHRSLAPSISDQPKLERGPCNMSMVRATPGIDAGIVAPIEQGKGAKIRVIEPVICGQGLRAAEIVR